ncbi:MAG TPA: HesA/MoeB/ThiF family protein [Dehalococcoidales bacterium]|nr:HesA/MoeB/ThiF family protein [Dehalococcoidales bacterium]
MLSQEELERYSRQILINGFGEEGQARLKKAKVFIAGAGGLGSITATYLAAAGVRVIRVVDHDTVELSNLNRQILHRDEDIGKNKVDSAAKRLKDINPEVKIEAIAEKITEANISKLVADSDLIVDAMDNLPTRYLLNKTAIEKKIPFFHGAVNGFEGRAMTIIPGQTACLRCVYRGAVVEGSFPVVGVTPGVIGCIQATEVIKYIVGTGQLLGNRLLVYDGLNMKFTQFKVKRDPNCQHCGALKDKS